MGRRPPLYPVARSLCLDAINNAALSIYRLRSNPQLPVRAAVDFIAWNPQLGIRLLDS